MNNYGLLFLSQLTLVSYELTISGQFRIFSIKESVWREDQIKMRVNLVKPELAFQADFENNLLDILLLFKGHRTEAFVESAHRFSRLQVMENRYQFSLDDLPPLLYMADDGACEASSDIHGYLPHGTEYDDDSSIGVAVQYKNSDHYSSNRQHYNEFDDEKKFHLPESSRTMNSQRASPSDLPQSCTSQDSPPKLRKKKPQECSKCGNHNISVLMKGHKHYCPYSDCSCDLCEVTHKKNYYSKMHQKLSRHRQGTENILRTDFSVKMYGEYPESRRRELIHDLHDTELTVLEEVKGLCMKEKKH